MEQEEGSVHHGEFVGCESVNLNRRWRLVARMEDRGWRMAAVLSVRFPDFETLVLAGVASEPFVS
jgi:hypothetical protein